MRPDVGNHHLHTLTDLSCQGPESLDMLQLLWVWCKGIALQQGRATVGLLAV